MVGDSPHSPIVNLSDADAAAHRFNRATNGFNALLAQLYCVKNPHGGRGDGSMLDGTVPFTGTISGGIYSTKPNEAYLRTWISSRNTAANNGIATALDPFDGRGGHAAATANGRSACRFTANSWEPATRTIRTSFGAAGTITTSVCGRFPPRTQP